MKIKLESKGMVHTARSEDLVSKCLDIQAVMVLCRPDLTYCMLCLFLIIYEKKKQRKSPVSEKFQTGIFFGLNLRRVEDSLGIK